MDDTLHLEDWMLSYHLDKYNSFRNTTTSDLVQLLFITEKLRTTLSFA